MLRYCALGMLLVACARPAVQAPHVTAESRAERDAREAKERAAAERFFAERRELVDAFVLWARSSAIRDDDLAGLDALIGDARVITLGEADHRVHEYLAFRNKLAKQLVEKHGVTAILVESGFTEATLADDYVMGTGTATSRDAAAALFSWAMPVALRENVALVEWLRAYNAKTARKVHIYGIDITGGRGPGIYAESRLAIDAALAYLAQHAPAVHRKLAARFAPLVVSFSTAGYLDLDQTERAELTAAVKELLAAFRDAQDTAEFRRARQHAAMAAVLETFFRQTVDRSTKPNLADVGLDGIRDATMAANVIWALGEEGADSRVFLFAHNTHVRRAAVTAWPAKLPPVVALGEYLANSLNSKLVVIGAVHGDGAPTATLDGLFAKPGLASYLLDLRDAPETVRAGLGQSWELRLDGFRALGQKPAWSAIPLRCFDALYYTGTSSEAALVE